MNILTVLARATDNADQFEVYWANGVQKQGLLRVNVPSHGTDKDVIAELGALHHLLVVKGIFGQDRAGRAAQKQGAGIIHDEDADRVQLHVTSGQIKKLMQQKSKKLHLSPYSFFLATRFAGSNISVSHDRQWIKPRALENVEEVTVGPALDDLMDVPGVGLAAVSVHAIEQIQRRGNGLSLAEAWHQIRRVVRTLDYEVAVSDEKRRRDIDRHGYSGRYLYSTLTEWNVIVAPAKGLDRAVPVIATAYFERRPQTELVRIVKVAA
ncbi:plasmid-like protein [Thauera sp. 27]|uniref:hypothetical protein n=1 Tax=Thauera sp. 27 TaxID=305700 RepID=UPI0002D07615|nr:hypothetical protein [Thauera sp. 27]ENO77571.1 plasmid-like protein [Thauera sp. 27]